VATVTNGPMKGISSMFVPSESVSRRDEAVEKLKIRVQFHSDRFKLDNPSITAS